MAMSAFRRSAASETKQRSGKGGKGNYWDRLDIPKQNSTPVLILRGAYKDPNPSRDLIDIDPATGRAKDVVCDFYKVTKHKRKLFLNGKETFRDTPCSAGPDPHNQQPCAGCAAMDAGDKTVTKSDYYLFTVIHLHPYHVHPLLDRNTRQLVMKQGTQEPVMVKTACTGRLCNFCRVSRGEAPIVNQGDKPWEGWAANQFSTVLGNRKYLEVGKSHLSNIDSFENIIGSKCFNVQCGGALNVDGYICPTCKGTCIDLGTDTRSDKELAEAVMRPYPCLTCRRSVFLEEVTSCPTCDAFQREPVKLSVFDCVLNLFKAGEGTKSQIQLQSHFPIDAYGQFLANNQASAQLLHGKTLRQIIEEIGKPFDFAEMFKPKSLDEQMKDLELSGSMPAQQQGAPAYGQQTFMPPPQMGQMGQPNLAGYQPQQSYPMQPGQPGVGFAPYTPQQGGVVMQQPPGGVVMQPQQPTQTGPAPFVPVARPNFGT